MIGEVETISRGGLEWYTQEFDWEDGNLECINLYYPDGDFAGEFESMEAVENFIKKWLKMY